ncbi:MAG: LysR family transcriptional regulator [Rhodospirillales bacterium]|nr:LysR family transcriptional regulator [Rhodospirillales bacterium]
MTIELRYLRHFAAAVEEGGMGRGARSLNISQPGLTRSIRLLEEHLKVTLFERGTKGITPTNYGINFYSRAKSILAETERAEVEITEMRGETESLVTVGALPSQANFVLPEATVSFLKTNEQTRVKVIQKARDEILPSLLAGKFDFIFCILDPVDADQRVTQSLLFYDRPSLIVRKAHPVFRAKGELFKKLLDYQWVLPRPEADQRLYINTCYANAGLALPQIAVECQTTPYLKSLVMQSDFIGVLPTNFESVEESAGLIRTIDPEGFENSIPFGIQYRSDRPISGSAQRLIREIENACRAMKQKLVNRLDFRI